MEVNHLPMTPRAKIATFLLPLSETLGSAGLEGTSQLKNAFTKRYNNSLIK